MPGLPGSLLTNEGTDGRREISPDAGYSDAVEDRAADCLYVDDGQERPDDHGLFSEVPWGVFSTEVDLDCTEDTESENCERRSAEENASEDLARGNSTLYYWRQLKRIAKDF